MHNLNGSAAIICAPFEGHRQASDIAALLADRFKLSPPPLYMMQETLLELPHMGLAVPRPGPDAAALWIKRTNPA